MRATLDTEVRLTRRQGSANPNAMWKMSVPRFLYADDRLAFWFADSVADALKPDIVIMAYSSYN